MSAPSMDKGPARVVLVTAAARGLGLHVARAFRERGDVVHVAWRRGAMAPPALQSEFTGRVHQADLLVEADAVRLVANVRARDARLDVLVHPVGEFATGKLEDAAATDLEALIASNVITSLHAFDAARSALRASRGAALFFGVAGLDGLRGRRETALYAAAKSALLVLVRSWALEEAHHGVRVNQISPGIVPHEHSAPMTQDSRFHERIPLGRAGTPEDVARAALFLCSRDASYLTGVDLPVAGGWLA